MSRARAIRGLTKLYCLRAAVDVVYMGQVIERTAHRLGMPTSWIADMMFHTFPDPLDIIAADHGLALIDAALVRGLREWRSLGPAAGLIAEQGRIAARVMSRVGREARRQLKAAR
jgi:hypothetical protein